MGASYIGAGTGIGILQGSGDDVIVGMHSGNVLFGDEVVDLNCGNAIRGDVAVELHSDTHAHVEGGVDAKVIAGTGGDGETSDGRADRCLNSCGHMNRTRLADEGDFRCAA